MDYRLEDQVGFLLRRAHQRASGIFSEHFRDSSVSPVQFAALVKIRDEGRVSQNQLGRLTHMDPATIMGVIKRLAARDLIRRYPDAGDRRRMMLGITSSGLKLVEEHVEMGRRVTEDTLAPLDPGERATFLELLAKLT
ncbi:MarR family winged helix-turn-helix transcriptional regulator [Sphingomonas oleivorans]|uniref:MarR family winged helix-turn-helix transcriptional regulator n=1 Tax=Sphingomonas oleivorans TaxID=1735121 RepID=UPI001A9ED636|nr:MarR family transcriptional regulator [Sphingomonas oleivorans]